MALPRVNKQSKHSAVSIHYIATGVYNLKDGKFNEPHPTRGDKSIKVRNYKLQGILCPDDPHKASEFFGHYNRLANLRYTKHLGQGRVQCTNVVISFGRELNWNDPADLARGVHIVHMFADTCFPQHGIYTGYQMDTSGKIPSAHTHLAVGEFNEVTGYSMTHEMYYGPHLINELDRIITRDNEHHIKQLTVIGDYGDHGWKSHQFVQPTLFENRLLPRLNLVMQSRLAINDDQLVRLMKPLNVIVHIHHKGEKRSSLSHPGRKPYQHDSLLMRIPGSHGTNGYIPAGKLRWLTKWSPNADLLYTMRTRAVMYALNKRYLSREPLLNQQVLPKLQPLMRGEVSPKGTIQLLSYVRNYNQKKGSTVMSDIAIQGMEEYMHNLNHDNKQSNAEHTMNSADSLYASLFASEAREAENFGVGYQPVQFSSATNDDFKSATGSDYSGSLDADSFYKSTTAQPSSSADHTADKVAEQAGQAEASDSEPEPSKAVSSSNKSSESSEPSSSAKKAQSASPAQSLTPERANYLADSASEQAYMKMAKLAGISGKQFGRVQQHYFYKTSSIADAVNYVSGADQSSAVSILNSAHSTEASALGTDYIPYGQSGYMASLLNASPIYQHKVANQQKEDKYKKVHDRDTIANNANHIIGNEAFSDKNYSRQASNDDIRYGAHQQHNDVEQGVMDMYSQMSPQGQQYLRSMALLGTINDDLFNRIVDGGDLTNRELGLKNTMLRKAGYLPDENGQLKHISLGMPLNDVHKVNHYLHSHQRSLSQGDFYRALNDERDKELWQKKFSPAYRHAYDKEIQKLNGQKPLRTKLHNLYHKIGGVRQQNAVPTAIRKCADTNDMTSVVKQNDIQPTGAKALHKFINWVRPYEHKFAVKMSYVADYAKGMLHRGRIRIDQYRHAHHFRKLQKQYDQARGLRTSFGHLIVDKLANYGITLGATLKARHGSIHIGNQPYNQLTPDDQKFIHRQNVIKANHGMTQDDFDLSVMSYVAGVRSFNKHSGRPLIDDDGNKCSKMDIIDKLANLETLHPAYDKNLRNYVEKVDTPSARHDYTLEPDEKMNDKDLSNVFDKMYQKTNGHDKYMKSINHMEKNNPVYAKKRARHVKTVNAQADEKEQSEQKQKAKVVARRRQINREQGISR